MYDLAISEKARFNGQKSMLIDHAMAGRVRLTAFLKGRYDDLAGRDALVAHARRDLDLAASDHHYLQLQATHDSALLIWFTCCKEYVDERNVAELTRARQIFTGVLAHIPDFSSVSRRDAGMMYNNGACATLLYDSAVPGNSEIKEDAVALLDTAIKHAKVAGSFETLMSFQRNKALANLIMSLPSESPEKEERIAAARATIDEMVSSNGGVEYSAGLVSTETLRQMVANGEAGLAQDLRVCAFDTATVK